MARPDVKAGLRMLRDMVSALIEYRDEMTGRTPEEEDQADADAKQWFLKASRDVKKVDRLKGLARIETEGLYEESWARIAPLRDDPEMEEAETEEGWKARIANRIIWELDQWDGNNDDGSPMSLQAKRSNAEDILHLFSIWDSNYGGIETEDENPQVIFSGVRGPRTINVSWPSDLNGPLQFPPVGKPFVLRGVSLTGNIPAPTGPTVAVDLVVYDGAGTIFYTFSRSAEVASGDFSLQWQPPSQIPDNFVILPAMRLELRLGDGATPPYGNYSFGESIWMIDVQ